MSRSPSDSWSSALLAIRWPRSFAVGLRGRHSRRHSVYAHAGDDASRVEGFVGAIIGEHKRVALVFAGERNDGDVLYLVRRNIEERAMNIICFTCVTTG